MTMFSLRAWRRRRVLARHAINDELWHRVRTQLPLLHRLTSADERRLRELALLFLHEKVFECASDMTLSETQRLWIAVQACLPILNLGLDWYDGWKAIVIYPDEFITRHEEMDEDGVVHSFEEVRSGEAWLNGPVILAWSEVADADAYTGHNLVVHEFAHKLDMLNGDANGLPPLHKNMSVTHWAEVFTAAFNDFQRRIEHDIDELEIDPYAAESPGEFFAVMSEVFFANPVALHRRYPAVYDQMVLFYRQRPLD